jgi:chromosome segregation ATPase
MATPLKRVESQIEASEKRLGDLDTRETELLDERKTAALSGDDKAMGRISLNLERLRDERRTLTDKLEALSELIPELGSQQQQASIRVPILMADIQQLGAELVEGYKRITELLSDALKIAEDLKISGSMLTEAHTEARVHTMNYEMKDEVPPLPTPPLGMINQTLESLRAILELEQASPHWSNRLAEVEYQQRQDIKKARVKEEIAAGRLNRMPAVYT